MYTNRVLSQQQLWALLQSNDDYSSQFQYISPYSSITLYISTLTHVYGPTSFNKVVASTLRTCSTTNLCLDYVTAKSEFTLRAGLQVHHSSHRWPAGLTFFGIPAINRFTKLVTRKKLNRLQLSYVFRSLKSRPIWAKKPIWAVFEDRR